MTQGMPLRTILFDTNLEQRAIAYAEKLCAEIENLEAEFAGVSLSRRVAFLLPPDAEFIESLRAEMTRLLTGRYEFATAAEYARWTGSGHEKGKQLVMDFVENFDGLECLISFAVDLDGPTSDLHARSRLYRSITRAQMLFVLVNRNISGGWVEWLRRTELDTTDFDLERARGEIAPVNERHHVVSGDETYTSSDANSKDGASKSTSSTSVEESTSSSETTGVAREMEETKSSTSQVARNVEVSVRLLREWKEVGEGEGRRETGYDGGGGGGDGEGSEMGKEVPIFDMLERWRAG